MSFWQPSGVCRVLKRGATVLVFRHKQWQDPATGILQQKVPDDVRKSDSEWMGEGGHQCLGEIIST